MRRVFGVIMAIILVAILSGCQSQPTPTPVPPKAAPTAVPTAAPAAKATEVPKPAPTAVPVATKPAAPAAPKEVTIRFSPTGTGGSSYSTAVAWSAIVNKYSEWVRVAVVPITGTTATLQGLARAKTDVTQGMDFDLRDLYSGVGDWGKSFGKRDDLRILFPAHENPIHFFALADSPIKSIADLKGKKVATWSKTSSTVGPTLQSLEANGINWEKDLSLYYGTTFDDTKNALIDGRADAALMPMGFPNSIGIELSTMKKIKMVPISGEMADLAMKKQPALHPFTIPGGVYKGVDAPVQTLSMAADWVTTTALTDDAAYEFLIQVDKHFAEAVALDVTIKNVFNREFVAERPRLVPWHNSSLRLFKEKGWLK